MNMISFEECVNRVENKVIKNCNYADPKEISAFVRGEEGLEVIKEEYELARMDLCNNQCTLEQANNCVNAAAYCLELMF